MLPINDGDLAEMRAVLAGLDPTDDEKTTLGMLVDTVVRARAMIDALGAIETQALAAAADLAHLQCTRAGTMKASEQEMPLRAIAAEFAAALRMSDRTMQTRLKDSEDLVRRFPDTFAAWRDGRITRRHATVIREAGVGIDDIDAREGYERVAVRAAEHDTPGRLTPIVKLLAARFDSRSIDDRHAQARRHREIRVFDLQDAMAEVRATLPAVLAHGICDRLTEQAKSIIRARSHRHDGDTEAAVAGGAGAVGTGADAAASGATAASADEVDTRTLDEVRADLFADLLLCGAPVVGHDGPRDGLAAITATVRMTVPVLTAAGRGTEPSSLTGYGPIDADTARRLLGGASAWERVMTSPVTGAVLAVDRYEPGVDLQRYLDARDEHCRFLGCRMPARRCDRDHTIEASRNGPTCVCNMESLCEGHHVLRHNSNWSVRQLGGGLLEWASPLGKVYIDRPDPVVRFVPDDADPPGWDPLPEPPGADGAAGANGATPTVSWPPPPDACTHQTGKRNPLLDPWLIEHESEPAPF